MVTYEDIRKVNAEIKMTDIGRGKEYAEVPQRVTAFRKLYPNGSLTSELVMYQDGVFVVKATACDGNGSVLGTGLAYEKEGSTFINRTSALENCETSAWGRCLAACGIIGGGDETVGSIASAEEVMNAQKQQMKMSEDEKKKELKDLLTETDSDVPLFLAWCERKFQRKVPNVDILLDKELDEAIKEVKRKKGAK